MIVGLYLILVTVLLVVSVAGFGAAASAASALYQRDLLKEPENERQHALLGRCVEWTRRIVSSGWSAMCLGQTVIFALAAAANPFGGAGLARILPAPMAAIGLAAAIAFIIVGRLALKRVRQIAKQYEEIVAGTEPAWVTSLRLPQTA